MVEEDDAGLRSDAVVVAAGASRRMEGTDKLLVPVGGLPLIAWTLAAIAAPEVVERIVLVAAADRIEEFRVAPWLPAKVIAVVPGGERRQESVAAGVTALAALHAGDPGARDRPVLVHDGARPLVSPGLVSSVARAVRGGGAAVPVLPVAETLKRVGPDALVHETVDRTALAAAQTPQGARLGLLEAAFATFPAGGPREFTDEAALLEACRIPVHAIPGEPANFKVTLPGDLRRLEHALARDPIRIGFGDDSHPFGPHEPLWLGGIAFPGTPGLSGHSDGDVALHAVAEALLGAAALGDLGRLFPADARTPRGIASSELLAEVARRLAAVGMAPATVDLLVIGARPRLSARLDEMRDVIAGLLGLPPGSVNVKASTGNLAGDEGAGRGITARAIATIRRAP